MEGCWSRRELSEQAIILGAGIDYTPEGRYRLTLQIARPAAFTGGTEGGMGTNLNQNLTWVVSATGKSIHDAQQNLSLQISRHLYWSHAIIMVFGEEAARHGVRDFTNFIHRQPQPRETMWVMVAKGTAENLLKSHSELEKTSSQSVGFIARREGSLSILFKDFIKDLASRGTNPVAPRVELVRQGEPQGPGMERIQRHYEVAFTGTAVFKDEKLVGWLDQSDSWGLLWLRGELKKEVIIVPSSENPEKVVCFEVLRTRTKVKPVYSDGQIRFYVHITADFNLVEQHSKDDFLNPEVQKLFEQKAAREIEHRAKIALRKAQEEYGVDIFRFGEAFHRKYKKEWRELKYHWNEEFTTAEVEIKVKANIRFTGLQARRASLKR